MRALKGRLIALGVLAGSVALLYHYGLSDEAKTRLKGAAKSMKDALEQINEVVTDAQGHVMQEDELPNRVETEAQWEARGF